MTAKRSQALSYRTAAANTGSMRICLNDFERFISIVKNIATIYCALFTSFHTGTE